MKIEVQYVNDSSGTIQAVQLPITEWEKVLTKLKTYEQILKIKSDLKEAFQQVDLLKKGKNKKQTLTAFLNEL